MFYLLYQGQYEDEETGLPVIITGAVVMGYSDYHYIYDACVATLYLCPYRTGTARGRCSYFVWKTDRPWHFRP